MAEGLKKMLKTRNMKLEQPAGKKNCLLRGANLDGGKPRFAVYIPLLSDSSSLGSARWMKYNFHGNCHRNGSSKFYLLNSIPHLK